MAVTVSEAIKKAREELSKLTGLELSSTSGVFKDKQGWHVSVEMVEKHSIPDGMDVLGLYAVLLDDDGNVIQFSRKKLRKRVDTYEVEEEARAAG